MKTKFQVEKPGEVQASMKITMSIASWLKLRDQLCKADDPYSRPAHQLKQDIDELLNSVTKEFYPTIREKEKADAKR